MRWGLVHNLCGRGNILQVVELCLSESDRKLVISNLYCMYRYMYCGNVRIEE